VNDVSVSRDGRGYLVMGPRTIPIPTTVSEAAQKFLAIEMPPMQHASLDDKEGWRAAVAASNASFAPAANFMLSTAAASVETQTINGVTVHVATPHAMRHTDRAHVRIHGGAWAFLGGEFSRAEAAATASSFGTMAYGVDYRTPPDHPFPAAVDDGVAVYRALLEKYAPKKIVISGASAGGNLTAGVTLKLRDEGLPMPGCVGLLTPALDLTWASDTIVTNNGIDTVLRAGSNVAELYAGGHDLTNPYISPLFGDLAKGFPPAFLQSGTRDLLLSDTVRMHRKLLQAGIPAELHVWEAMPHGGFGGVFGSPTPEDDELQATFVAFVDRWLG
jgi:acetyl esterase/lipase